MRQHAGHERRAVGGELALLLHQPVDELVEVQAGSRFAVERAGHERRPHAGLRRDLAHDLLGQHERVGERQRRQRCQVDLVLARPRFVVAGQHLDPGTAEQVGGVADDRGAQPRMVVEICGPVDRRHVVEQVHLQLGRRAPRCREVAEALEHGGERGARVSGPRVPVHGEHGAGHPGGVTHAGQRRGVGAQPHVGFERTRPSLQGRSVERLAVAHRSVEPLGREQHRVARAEHVHEREPHPPQVSEVGHRDLLISIGRSGR